MEPARQKFFARLLLAACSVLGLLWLAHLDYSQKISTNIVDLIPTDERSPELAVVRSFVNDRQARVVLFALSVPSSNTPPSAAADRFAAALKKSSAFTEAVAMGDTTARDALGKFVFTRRFDLLLPTWLGERQRAFAATAEPPAHFSSWLAEDAASALDRFLAQPESVAFQELMPADPLLLIPAVAQKAQTIAAPGSAAPGMALIWALIKDSPFSEEGQQPVFDAIAQALTEAKRDTPELKLEWTGVNRFAADSRQRIHGELSWLNTLSIIAVLGVACVFVRRIWKVLHLLPVILLSVLGAWVAVTAAFERLHVLVFVVGSLLTGVAIDYGFYLYMQPALRPDEPYREKLGRLIKPLLSSCLTTVIGFSLLLFSELPLIRQLGVFVSAGLLSALVAAILYFAQLNRAFLETRHFEFTGLVRHRGWIRALFAVATVAILVGLFRLHWHDDVRELEIPSGELRANDQRLRGFFGDSGDHTVYLTRGTTPAAARAALADFMTWHQQRFPDTAAASLGLVLPTEADWQGLPSHLQALGDFEAKFREALSRHGYTPESFSPFFDAWTQLRARTQQAAYPSLVEDLRGALTGPLSLLMNTGEGNSWFLTVAEHPPGAEPPAALATLSLNQLESLNALFGRYRASALRLSAIGLSLVGASVFVLYGWRRGIRIFSIPSGSCLFAFGLLGLCGQTLNLFHLLGAFLGVCLSHNYAIFSAENAGRHEAPPPSIRLSALTAASSFGVLGLSKIPVVSALGITVALIVLTALLMVECEPLGRAEPRSNP